MIWFPYIFIYKYAYEGPPELAGMFQHLFIIKQFFTFTFIECVWIARLFSTGGFCYVALEGSPCAVSQRAETTVTMKAVMMQQTLEGESEHKSMDHYISVLFSSSSGSPSHCSTLCTFKYIHSRQTVSLFQTHNHWGFYLTF